jgi:hypothetical protein
MRVHKGKSTKVATEEAAVGEVSAQDLSMSPLYGVAMLKIALELKKADARPMEQLISGVLAKMGLDEAAFRGFLDANGGLLRAIAQKRVP